MNPKLILVRGLPGSGKSTLAAQLVQNSNGLHYEADQFFVDSNGNYNFDAGRLGAAHQWCQNQAYNGLANGFIVVVSNTFTTVKELKPYFDIASNFGIVPQVVTCENQFGNIHSVPAETLDRMKQRWAHDISVLFKREDNAVN